MKKKNQDAYILSINKMSQYNKKNSTSTKGFNLHDSTTRTIIRHLFFLISEPLCLLAVYIMLVYCILLLPHNINVGNKPFSTWQKYLGILDLQSAASRVYICSVEWCLGTLGTLHRVECDDRIKDQRKTTKQKKQTNMEVNHSLNLTARLIKISLAVCLGILCCVLQEGGKKEFQRAITYQTSYGHRKYKTSTCQFKVITC